MTIIPDGAEILHSALEYQESGFSVVPVRAHSKKAAFAWKPYQTDRADEAQIREWFGIGREFGIAIILGRVSGDLVCRDFDELAAYDRWAEEHPELKETLPTVKSSRGAHVYFRADLAVIRAASKSGGGGTIKFPDGELRGDGAYCVAPPSIHPDGTRYEWLIPPNGEIPHVDLYEAGFLPCNREDRESREDRETETAECTETAERAECTETCPRVSQGSPLSLLHDIESAIEQTQPRAFRKRHDLLFRFARELKAIAALADVDVQSLKPYVRQWYDRAKALITSPFEETWFDFAEGWNKVRFPVGEGPVDMAFARVLDSDLPAVADEYEQKELRLLVGLCRELQRATGPGQPFYLACRTGARLLGVDHSTVSRWLRGLQVDHILELVKPGSQKEGKASRYLYLPADL